MVHSNGHRDCAIIQRYGTLSPVPRFVVSVFQESPSLTPNGRAGELHMHRRHSVRIPGREKEGFSTHRHMPYTQRVCAIAVRVLVRRQWAPL